MTIEGDSYFDLPPNDESRTSSLITPTTFMDASSAKTPEAHMPTDRSDETPADESASGTQTPGEDVILLVEDNAINMRVRLPSATCSSAKPSLVHTCVLY